MSLPPPQTCSPASELGPRAQRTRTLLVETARGVFLKKGYGGARIEDIADAAGISRGSFYTYFPSKRDVLLAAGAESAAEAKRVIGDLEKIPTAWTPDDIADWIAGWLRFLDVHGDFAMVWAQAGFEDQNFRRAGVRTQVRIAKQVGQTLVRLGHSQPIHAAADGLALIGMMERLWYYHHVADGMLDNDELLDTITRIIISLIDNPVLITHMTHRTT